MELDTLIMVCGFFLTILSGIIGFAKLQAEFHARISVLEKQMDIFTKLYKGEKND